MGATVASGTTDDNSWTPPGPCRGCFFIPAEVPKRSETYASPARHLFVKAHLLDLIPIAGTHNLDRCVAALITSVCGRGVSREGLEDLTQALEPGCLQSAPGFRTYP